eukprot:Skav206638  [mRNA]  locus=scaffold166:52308:53551:- [translate_table: standard]
MGQWRLVAASWLVKPDEKWGETPVAWIVCRNGMSITDEVALRTRETCAMRLMRYRYEKGMASWIPEGKLSLWTYQSGQATQHRWQCPTIELNLHTCYTNPGASLIEASWNPPCVLGYHAPGGPPRSEEVAADRLVLKPADGKSFVADCCREETTLFCSRLQWLEIFGQC